MLHCKKSIGAGIGLLAAAILVLLPLEGLSVQGKTCLALTIMTVIFWAFQVAQPGYISGLLLALLVIFQVATPSVVFASWTGTTMYLIIGAYLIAGAVKNSGLGERIAYWFIAHFMRSYRSVFVSIFCMTFVLSLIIPHPWPRAFLIMSVMAQVIRSASIPRQDAVKIGYAVFAASVPVSTIFLTGDSTINPLAAQYAGVSLNWLSWLKIMGPPSIIAAVLTCMAFLLIFPCSPPVVIDKVDAQNKLQELGRFTGREKRSMIWLAVAVVVWLTDSLHGIDIGWATLAIAMLMAMPVVGGLLEAKTWNEVPVHVLLFISAAMAIGKVGSETGMNQWIAATLLPQYAPSNPFLFAALVCVLAIVIHMLLGSVIAVMGVAVPAILAFASNAAIPPLVPALWVLTAVVFHYVFPFQNMSILVGMGEENGMYSQKETLRFSLPLLVITFIIIVPVETLWWKLIGLL